MSRFALSIIVPSHYLKGFTYDKASKKDANAVERHICQHIELKCLNSTPRLTLNRSTISKSARRSQNSIP